jgi:thiol-disulfide isomerase/thioredoxin
MSAARRALLAAAICLAALPRYILAAQPAPLPESLLLQKPSEAVEAPEFTLKDVGGKAVRLKDLRGKLVFLNFFATWCGPCREEIPAMEQLHRVYRDKGLAFLAVDMREGGKSVKAFLAELKATFPTVLDEDGSVSHEYGIRALPVSFLIGRDGVILWRAIGAREWNSPEARRYFDQLVSPR